MNKIRYVIDTTGIISYFSEFFKEPPKISQTTLKIISNALNFDDRVLLTVPSIVFVEIFDKWFKGKEKGREEFRAMIRSEVFNPLQFANNVEIRGIDFEVSEAFLNLDDRITNLESHDKIVLATAIVLQSPLITSDDKIRNYVQKDNVIPGILN